MRTFESSQCACMYGVYASLSEEKGANEQCHLRDYYVHSSRWTLLPQLRLYFLQFSACYQQQKHETTNEGQTRTRRSQESYSTTVWNRMCRYTWKATNSSNKWTNEKKTFEKNSKTENQKLVRCVCVDCNVVTGVHSIIIRTESRRCYSAALSLLFECGVLVYGCDGVRFRLTLSLQLIG